MAFELETMTKARVLDVRTLASKDRKPDEPPGAQLLLQAILPGEALSMFDGFLLSALFRKGKGSAQGKLEGMEGMELTNIGEHVKRMPWAYEQTGCTIEIDRGLGGRQSNIELDDCKVHRVSFAPQQGGGVKVQWTVDAPGQSDAVRGKLTGLKATEIELTIALPEVQQEEIPSDDDAPPAKKKAAAKPAAPQKDATEQFIDRHAPAH